ncbi:MAG: hypothetical protein NTW25_15430 [Candidatus Kapabacteria bacterium]|nr:hypothetical protein [Candidatus Kapabacteria bacterium]
MKPQYPPTYQVEKHIKLYEKIRIPNQIIKLEPNYLGEKLERYDRLKNIEINDQNGWSDEGDFKKIFNDSTFNKFTFYVDNQKYVYHIYFEKKLEFIHNEYINNKYIIENVKPIFKLLLKTYGNNFKIYETVHESPRSELESLISIIWNYENSYLILQFDIIEVQNKYFINYSKSLFRNQYQNLISLSFNCKNSFKPDNDFKISEKYTAKNLGLED